MVAVLGVADHDRRTVDPPRHRALVADDALGLELRAVVRRGEVLALVEHRLVEGADVLAGRGDRGDLVEAAGLERRRPGASALRVPSTFIASLVAPSAVMS